MLWKLIVNVVAAAGLNDMLIGQIGILAAERLEKLRCVEVEHDQTTDLAGDDAESAEVLYREPLIKLFFGGSGVLVVAPGSRGDFRANGIDITVKRNNRVSQGEIRLRSRE